METQKSNRRIIVGLILVVIGFLLLLSNFDIVPNFMDRYLFIWPNILILVGLLVLTNPNNRTTGLIILAIGGFFWIKDVFHIYSFWRIFWPSIVILVGALMIFRHKIDAGRIDFRDPELSGTDYIDDVAIFGGGEKVVETNNFKGGRATSIFGGSNINLLGCELAHQTNVIDVFAVFGGTSFVVPDDWQVKLDVVSIFGGYSDKRTSGTSYSSVKADKVLIIKGVVIFGGGEIKSIRAK